MYLDFAGVSWDTIEQDISDIQGLATKREFVQLLKLLSPVVTGRLRSSITLSPDFQSIVMVYYGERVFERRGIIAQAKSMLAE